MKASQNGQLEVVRTLLEVGGDVDAKSNVRNQMMMMIMMIIIMIRLLIILMMMLMMIVIDVFMSIIDNYDNSK